MTPRSARVPLKDILGLLEERSEVRPGPEYPQVGVYGFGRGLFERDTVRFGETTYKYFNRLYEGSIVISQVKGWEGAIAVVSKEFAGRFVSPEYRTLQCDESQVDRAYLLHVLLSPGFSQSILFATRGQGARRERVRPERLLMQQIRLPPLAEQRRIVAKIERVAAKVDRARVLHDQSKTALGAFDSSAAAAIAHSVPATCWRPLGEIVEVGGGGTPSKDNPAFWGGDIPWISPKDMKRRRIQSATDYITRIAVENSAARLHAPGSVLIVIRGMILAHTVPVAVLDVNAAINQDMKALSPHPSVEPDYLCSILWALNGEMLALIDRSSHDTRKLNTAKLLAFRIPVPPPEEQRRIVAYLDGLQARIGGLKALQAQTRAELDALLPSILDRAFKGEL